MISHNLIAMVLLAFAAYWLIFKSNVLGEIGKARK